MGRVRCAHQKKQDGAHGTPYVFYMIQCRSLKDNLFKIGFFSNPPVFMGIEVITLEKWVRSQMRNRRSNGS